MTESNEDLELKKAYDDWYTRSFKACVEKRYRECTKWALNEHGDCLKNFKNDRCDEKRLKNLSYCSKLQTMKECNPYEDFQPPSKMVQLVNN